MDRDTHMCGWEFRIFRSGLDEAEKRLAFPACRERKGTFFKVRKFRLRNKIRGGGPNEW
jgi:hypothetical protein